MSTYIVKVRDRFVEWSTICDGPVSAPMTREELFEATRQKGGVGGVVLLRERMTRVDAKGTSSFNDANADQTMWLNRAGQRETALTKSQLEEWLFGELESPPRGVRLTDDDGDGWGLSDYLGKVP